MLRFAVDDLYKGVTAEKLGRYAMMLFGIAIAAGLFKYAMRQFIIAISRRLEYELRNELFEHLQTLDAPWFQSHRTGETMSIATNDLSAVRMMLGPGVMYTVNTIIVSAVSIGFMVSISPRLTFYSLLPLPLVSLSVWWFGDRIHKRFEGVQARFARLSAHVQENLAGMRVVRAFTSERRQAERFAEHNRDYLEQNLDLIRTSGVFQPSLAFFSGLGALLVVWVGGREAVKGHITIGQFVAFTVYLGMLNWPMVALGWVINIFQRGLASYGRIHAILVTPPSIASPGTPAAAAKRDSAQIEFRHLTFTYPGAAEPALHDVSFTVPAGRTVALVGRTGSGKSTVLSLLPRVFDPPPGTVFLDGVDVREWDLDALRARIAPAPQETFLFSATVAENIAYGAHDAAPTAIEAAAKMANLDGDVRGFPDGYETRVGERGITLSGGQRQRAAIARAVLREAPVLLLDDCLSAVDTQTEEAILQGLRGEMRRRTCLLVSHRVSAVREADEILVFDRGRIAERGKHDELLALDGRYAALHRAQQLEEEIEAS
ncbi:MAG: ABC transporter ATP-binding protein [Candidatus Eisenbacteria bacterium]|uniref:ABC transporter ATP-binding protein n=1 Tax=Eiseniibacteriota bacterium TaxID=2212470 RepID=A0A933W2K7_UNCEI|nr:ABC transporter ATP-binding protein [Candidatus Eisenbacteria bacterium]